MNNDLLYVCGKCGHEFYDKYDKEKLVCPKCNAQDEDILMSVSKEDYEKMERIENYEFTCDECYEHFMGKDFIDNHFNCPKCNANLGIDIIGEAIKEDKEFGCITCDRLFTRKEFFKNDGYCPHCHDKLENIDTWADYKAVELDGPIPDEFWDNV